MLKKISCVLLCCLLALGIVFSGGCGEPLPAESQSVDEKPQIVATVFAAYDFARRICGDAADVSLLLPPGAESHSYEPPARDIIKISGCDLLICVGGESEAWVDSVLDSLDGQITVLRMMDCVQTVVEETVEGMENGEEHEPEEAEYDEHVWTSPKNAILIAQAIQEALSAADPDNSALYFSNRLYFVEELDALDRDFAEFFAGVDKKLMIFGDRFPLRYFVEEYGIEYYAAFPGCSAQSEPSAATMAFLIDKVKSEGVKAVFYIEFSRHLIADSISEATGVRTALFHTCHNVTQDEMSAGVSYISLMRGNLATLREVMQ